MNMNLTITNINDEITWELWGRALSISRIHKYKLVSGAIKAAKCSSKSFNINIVSCKYEEPNHNYSCYLHVL